jgi:hypothetical protein
MTTYEFKNWEDNCKTCKCKDAKCRKCLLANCKDNGCKIHSKNEKLLARYELIKNLEDSVEKDEQKLSELKRELNYINEIPEKLHMLEMPESAENRNIILDKLYEIGIAGLFILAVIFIIIGIIATISFLI